MTRIFFAAGESSGDIHGANLIRALRDIAPAVQCEGLGGRRMAAAGMELRYDLAEKAIMGFSEIVKSFGMMRRLFKETVEHLRTAAPDALVVIDYPGFNMRLAQKAKELGIPVIYYISPQVWAWKKGRIHTLARIVEKMLVIFPFEEKLYKDIGVDCSYVGHPLFDHIESDEGTPLGSSGGEPLIGLMPGSREQEIGRIFPVMAEVARDIRRTHPEARFVCPCVDAARRDQILALSSDLDIEVIVGRTYDLLRSARLCVVASGTATLETALFGVPMVVLYRMSSLTYWLARFFVDIDAIAIVNILAGKKIVHEFIQGEANATQIVPVALSLIEESPERAEMLNELAAVRTKLGGAGASKRAAEEVLAVVGGSADG